MKRLFLIIVGLSLLINGDRYKPNEPVNYGECTIGVFGGWATEDGRPMLWKNRDVTNDIQKFCFFEPRMPHAETTFYSFVGNVYSSDTSRVYMGINEVGFGIINANCYNLNDSLSLGIDDGELLRLALERCKNIAEFEDFLDNTSIKGRKDCWNIGAIDAYGGARMYECSNYSYAKYDANNREQTPDGIIIRTTFALSGSNNRPSMNRYKRAYNLAHTAVGEQPINAKFVLQTLSRDLFNYLADPYPLPYTGQQNGQQAGFIYARDVTINRDITRSVMVIRGVRPSEDPRLATSFCTIGPPVVSVAYPIWAFTREIPPVLNQGSEVPMFAQVMRHRSNLYPLSKAPDYLNSLYLKNFDGTGLFNYTIPLEDISLGLADSCVALWNAEFPARADMVEAQNSIAGYIYGNYSQIPYPATGIERPEQYDIPSISCYPNPFNAHTTIFLNGFQSGSKIAVNIYDLLGRQVRSFEGAASGGDHFIWDGRDDSGNRMSSGVYLVRAGDSRFSKTLKTVLIK